MNLGLIGLYSILTMWVENVDEIEEEEVSIYPGLRFRLSAHVSQTMFTNAILYGFSDCHIRILCLPLVLACATGYEASSQCR